MGGLDPDWAAHGTHKAAYRRIGDSCPSDPPPGTIGAAVRARSPVNPIADADADAEPSSPRQADEGSLSADEKPDPQALTPG